MTRKSALKQSCLLLALLFSWCTLAIAGLTPQQELGRLLYFDRYLSLNHNQSCASCHDPGAGFADPLDLRLPELYPVSVGSNTALVGGRNAPPAGYALFSPPFFFNAATGIWTGGQFWDGRAATLADQAKGPFLNPVEMAMPSKAAVLAALIAPENQQSPNYLLLFKKVYKLDLQLLNLTDPAAVDAAYNQLAAAIGEFEKSDSFRSFSSKYDYVKAGRALFTADEAAGEVIFNGAGKCNLCHVPPLFTDFTYDNLGIPHNPNPLTNANPPDLGLGAIVGDPLQNGKFKVSSLRNVALTAPYGHNGYFATLAGIVHFYNTRDVDPAWPAPEVADNVNVAELGNLGLTATEEAQLVAFLLTLTDGFGTTPARP